MAVSSPRVSRRSGERMALYTKLYTAGFVLLQAVSLLWDHVAGKFSAPFSVLCALFVISA